MKQIYKKNHSKYMTIIEHLQELKERMIITLAIFCVISVICLVYTKKITLMLQQPALGIKFLQLAPGEYLFVSIKIALYSAIIISCPFSMYQILKFILPGLTKEESSYLIPIVIGSIALFFLGTLFSYKILIPITLKFLISYGSDIVEPMWSFDEYFNFIILIILSTGLCFQIPIIQIILGIHNIIRWEQMLEKWKYIAFIATVIGAIITPSTDPITQICMTITMLVLYFSGIILLKKIKTE
uniref:Sec-independent protein translocase component TatC n=1 Tax=Pleurostichidium falkenbergii TaxID=121064 RepID=A0A4D6UW68_9FLOR|nr:Sec-independent protein translocase component TatC [Pleurostichidium falkenbergii]QCH39667.1 Sec-independent protein translocase component TatC [Pleurostichidium falkenbergii]